MSNITSDNEINKHPLPDKFLEQLSIELYKSQQKWFRFLDESQKQ